MTTKKQIATRVKEERNRLGISQADVASRLGISRSAVSQIEAGERDLSSTELASITELFGISAGSLLARSEQPLNNELQEQSTTGQSISPRKFDPEKFKQVLLYILEQTAGLHNVGQTVLYKLLYFSDFNYFEKYADYLTGADYQKNHFGPTPYKFSSVVDRMIKAGEVIVDKNQYHGHEQVRYIPLIQPDLRVFNGAAKEVIDQVIDRLAHMSATEISEYSHGDTPWRVAKDNEAIDYETVFYRTPGYSVGEFDSKEA